MTEPTIDLSKDLELWCDFAPRYYDSQRNCIQDKSGYGRHAEASGGPTVGVEGPDDFEATSFDGSDDHFICPTTLQSPTFTTAIYVRLNNLDGTVQQVFGNSTSGGNIGDAFAVGRDNNFKYFIQDGTDVNRVTYGATSEYEWFVAVLTYDGTTGRLYVNGEVVGTKDTGFAENNNDNFVIGSGVDSTNFAEVSLAFAAKWSRVLSVAEIRQLSSITGPRRAML